MRDPLNFFTKDDCMIAKPECDTAFISIERANHIISEHVGPKVFGNPDVPNSWGLSRTGWCDKPMTHSAHLFCVRKLALGELEGGE